MTATRETYKLGIDIINPAPTGTGGDMLQDDIKTIADLLESHATSIAGKANTSHTHATSDVTGLDTALNSKASISHTHAESEITNLVTDLAGKANTSHTHTTSEVTGLDSALAGKQDVSNIVTITDSAITLTVANNTIYNCTSTAITAVTLVAGSGFQYCTILLAKTATTTPTWSIPSDWDCIGSDCSAGVFSPSTEKEYNISIEYIGGVGTVYINSIVRN